MCNTGEIRGNFRDHGLKTLIEHFFEIVVLPPRLGDMMVGENLSVGRSEKSGTKNSHVYFRTAPAKARERVVVGIGGRLATAGQPGVMQSQSRLVVVERNHDSDETDARLIGPDNRLRHLALGF